MSKKISSKQLFLNYLFFMVFLELCWAFWAISSYSSEAGNELFLGFSYRRIIILTSLLIPAIYFGFLSLWSSLFSENSQKLVNLFDHIFLNRVFRQLVFLGGSFLFFSSTVLLLMPIEQIKLYADLVSHIYPLLGLCAILGLQILAVQFFWTVDYLNTEMFALIKKIFPIALAIFVLFMLIIIWIKVTGIGWIPEKSGWNFPGTPVMLAQLLVAWFLGGLLVLFKDSSHDSSIPLIRNFVKLPATFDLLVCILLFCFAFWVWFKQPLTRGNYFTPNPSPPNFEYYPYSDAKFYDQSAQIILIGNGENNKVVLRPLYIFLLTLFHKVGGQNFQNIILLQILFLAIMPVFAYLLVRDLGGRAAGLTMALFVIFREQNSIALNNVIETTHSKLLLSDVPTMALMLVAVYFYMRWLRLSEANVYYGILSGGFLGFLVLARSQAQLLLPILIIGMIFSEGWQFKRFGKRLLVFLIGFFMIVMPWMVRNYQVSGHFTVENTEFYIRLFAGNYSEPTDTVDQLPNETFDEYSKRINSQIVKYILNHPDIIFNKSVSYFFHNEFSSLAALPMTSKLYAPKLYVKSTPFWSQRMPELTFENGFFLIGTLGLIALGLGSSIRRIGFIAVMPLLIHFGYNLSIVPARISGWRYMLPVDWILHMYYVLGLMTLTLIAVSLILNRISLVDYFQITSPRYLSHKSNNKTQIFWVIVIFLVGIGLPIIERLIPQRYPYRTNNVLIKQQVPSKLLFETGIQILPSDLQKFLETETGATVLYGRALYPSYYKQGEFHGESSPNLLEASAYSRLQFDFIGDVNDFVFIPLNTVPEYFPHASDVFVVGCIQDASIRALMVKVNDTAVMISSPWNGFVCSNLD